MTVLQTPGIGTHPKVVLDSRNYDLNTGPYVNPLSVSDIERLAKAGVTVTLTDIMPIADPPTDPMAEESFALSRIIKFAPPLEKAFWLRYVRTKGGKMHPYVFRDGVELPFKIMASEHDGDRVVVSFHPHKSQYEPFQLTDNGLIYPSDALMASVALWEQEHR